MRPPNFLHPKSLLPALTTAVIASAVVIPMAISLAALVFSGSLSSYLSAGVGYFLMGAMALSLIVALSSSFKPSIAVPQDTPAVLLALVVSGIAASMGTSVGSDALFSTVVAAIILTSLLTGLVFLLLGIFKLGNLVRYIPYPVIGGFLAGTGWLLSRGGMQVLTGTNLGMDNLAALMQPEMLLKWLPGAAFGVLMLLILRRSVHFAVVPAMILGSVLLSHLGFWLAGLDLSSARAMGLLMGPFPQGGMWEPFTLANLGAVSWQAVLSQSGGIATIILLCVVALLLNASGLELDSRREIDLNRELRANGLANLLGGLAGSPPGFSAMALSSFGHRLNSFSRLNGIMFALICGVAVLFGAPILALVPTWVVGGLLLFLGLSFLVEWLYDAWFRLSKGDYLVVLAMLAMVAALGPLQGVGLGVALSTVMFIYEYSKTSVIKHTFNSRTYQSRVDRSPDENAFLADQGDWLMVFELQGFLFFGTANHLYEAVRYHINNPDGSPPRFIVLDFRLVTGLDASAAIGFAKLKQLAAPLGIFLVFTGLSHSDQHKLAKDVLNVSDQSAWRELPDLDHGIEWCEDQILSGMARPEQPTGPVTISRSRIALDDLLRSSLRGLLEQLFVEEGQVLIQQGDPPKGLFFIDYGSVTAYLEMPGGERMRLRSMGSGTVVGEIGMYLDKPASASVVANETSLIYFLPGEELRDLEKEDPQTAAELHRFMVRLVGQRLLNTMATLQAMAK